MMNNNVKLNAKQNLTEVNDIRVHSDDQVHYL